MEAYFAKLKSAGAPRCQQSYDRIEQLFTKEHNWTNAYAIEQLLIHLFDDCTLASELQSRIRVAAPLREAKDTLRPALAQYYATEAAKTSQSPNERRALLSRLVNDLQWRYTVNEVKRGYSKEITLKTGQLFIFSLVVFAISVLLTLAFPNLKQFDMRLLVPAVLAGCWGAAFSMLSSLRDRLDATDLDGLKVLRARWVLYSRALIGAGAASVLYFFFVSGLISGSAFPDLKSAAPSTAWQLNTFGLLVVWCFVAGFSERLIPGLLRKTEARLEPESASDRYRPTVAGNPPSDSTASNPGPVAVPANTATNSSAGPNTAGQAAKQAVPA